MSTPVRTALHLILSMKRRRMDFRSIHFVTFKSTHFTGGAVYSALYRFTIPMSRSLRDMFNDSVMVLHKKSSTAALTHSPYFSVVKIVRSLGMLSILCNNIIDNYGYSFGKL